MRLRRFVVVALLAALACGLGACAGFTAIGKGLGLINPPPFDINQPIVEEFRFTMSARDVAQPPIDYTFSFSRTGRLEYDVTVRKPVRFRRRDAVQVSEDDILALWRALQEAQFDQLPEQYISETPVVAAGVRTFWATIGEQDKRVETHYTRPKVLHDLQKQVLDLIPPHVLSVKEGTRSPDEAPEHYVGDRKTRVFYASDAEQLEEVPEERRVIFRTKYDALDHGYHPDTESQPMLRPD